MARRQFEQIGRLATAADAGRAGSDIPKARLPVFCEGETTCFGIVPLTGGGGIVTADASAMRPKGIFPWASEADPDERRGKAALFARDKLFCYTPAGDGTASEFEIIDRPAGVDGKLVAVPFLGRSFGRDGEDGVALAGEWPGLSMLAYLGDGGIRVRGPFAQDGAGRAWPDGELGEVSLGGQEDRVVLRPGALFLDEKLYGSIRVRLSEGGPEERPGSRAPDEETLVSDHRQWCLKEGLRFPEEALLSFHNAMKSDGGVILRSPSGTGKTGIARCYAEALGADFFEAAAPESVPSVEGALAVTAAGPGGRVPVGELAASLGADRDRLAVLEVSGLASAGSQAVWEAALGEAAGQAPNLLLVVTAAPESEGKGLPPGLFDRFAALALPGVPDGPSARTAPSGTRWTGREYRALSGRVPCPKGIADILREAASPKGAAPALASPRTFARAGALVGGLSGAFSKADAADIVLSQILVPKVSGGEEAAEAAKELRSALTKSGESPFRRCLDALARKEKECELYGYIR